MSVAMLRVTGATIKIRQFLDQTSLDISAVYWEGDVDSKSRGPNKTSGFNVDLSKTDWAPIEIQQAEALHFLNENREQMDAIQTLGLDAVVDFALHDRASEELPWPSYALSSKFIEVAGSFGFGVSVSFYGPAE